MRPRVLLVDDSLTVRMDLEEALAGAGFDVRACASLAEARAALRAGTFDLAVLDVLLPDGDGLELLREVKSGSANTPAIMLSTEAEVRDRVRGLKTGADDYVGKPYDRAWVVRRARELCGHRGASGTSVLVIDDSASVRESLREALVAAGYEPLTASGGDEGVRLAADRRPAAVIVDSHMPGGDGASVIRRLRQDAALRRTPVVMLTASENAAYEVTALDAGADAYCRKDEGLDVVLAKVGALLRGSRADALAAGPALDSPKRILAVDDSQTFLNELGRQLREDGYEVALARSGEEALELLAVQRVDCVLLDLLMPGLSGTETCRAIKADPARRDLPLIMLTSLDERSAMIEGINAGADDYIAKSADFEVLRARLRAQIRRRQFEDENQRIREALSRREKEASEARAARQLAETRASLLDQLEKKNAELESFSYSVSHDLRAPLRAVDGFCQALEEDCGAQLDDRGRRHLARVRANVTRMGRLIDDLLAFSRIGRQEMIVGAVDMEALFRSVAAELATPAAEIRIGPLPPVRADASLLRQVVSNLLSNAIKYSATRKPALVEVSGGIEEGDAVYRVKDNGVGFDPKYAHKLFQVFQRLHRADEFEGTGVGLALLKRIIERHGGRVGAESRPGEGAVFWFRIPAGAEHADRA